MHGLGLDAANGINLTEGWYWDQNDEKRAFGEKFMARTQRMPNTIQVGTYSAVTQYLKAIEAAKTDETKAVAAKLHEMPVDDVFTHSGKVQANGRMAYDMYLFQVKAAADSTKPWDYYKEISTVPAADAYLSVEDSGCDVASFPK